MPDLYPRIKPYATHRLAVDDIHTLHIEESGEPGGTPVLFVHGGPGAGCSPMHRRFFNPEAYRIILFDQRGCGQSLPHAELAQNTTQDLLADMERIRELLGVEQWMLFGGSWGATLSLVYAETFPERVMGLILRGVFLGREQEIQWFYQGGAARFFPDHWQTFISLVPENEQHNIIEAYFQRLAGDNELVRMAAGKAWARWEGQLSSLQPSKSIVSDMTEPYTAMSLARLETHYFRHQCFLEPNQILKNVERIAEIPGTIVQGRYDMVCPIETAYALYQAWPNCELDIISDAGHSVMQRGTIDALIRATNAYSKRFRTGA